MPAGSQRYTTWPASEGGHYKRRPLKRSSRLGLSESLPNLGNQHAIGDREDSDDGVCADSPEKMIAKKQFKFQSHIVLWVRFAREDVVEKLGNRMAPAIGKEAFEDPEFEEDQGQEQKNECRAFHLLILMGLSRRKSGSGVPHSKLTRGFLGGADFLPAAGAFVGLQNFFAQADG